VELDEVIRRRRMVRSFEDRPLTPGTIERLLDLAVRAPSAGFTQGWEFIVLEGPSQTARYWDVTLPAAQRESFPWPGLLNAAALVIPLAHAQDYVDRYGESDKAATGLGSSVDDWPVPYWLIDTAMTAMLLLLSVVDAELGALFFGMFEHEQAVLTALGVPDGFRPIGTIAIGHPASEGNSPSQSVRRGRRPMANMMHRGGW